MAHSLLMSASAELLAQSTTKSFVPIGVTYSGGSNSPETTESQTEIVQRTAGVLSKLTANCTTHTSNTVISLDKNASATGINETITIAGTGITTDSTHTDAVTAADKWDYTLSALASTFSLFSNVFAANSNTVCRLVSYFPGGSLITSVTTVYSTPMGYNDFDTTGVASGQITIKKTGTFQFLALNSTANSAGANSFIRTAKGSTPTIGNCSITLNGAGTGIVEDTTHSDTVTAGDLWEIQCVAATSGSITVTYVAIDFITTTGDSIIGTADSGNTHSPGASTTANMPLSGNPVFGAATEAQVNDTVQDTYLYSNLFANTSTAVGTTDTVALRTAGTTSQITLTITAGGQLGNTTNTYTALATDVIDFKVITSATAGTRGYVGFWVHANLGGGAAVAAILPKFFTVQNQAEFLPGLLPTVSNRPPMFVT